MIDGLCMNCLQQKKAQGACLHCGFDETTYAASPHHLPLRTILAGKYLVGRVLGEGGFGITYLGWDLNLDLKIAIKEYYPTGFVTRENTTTNTVTPYMGEKAQFFTKGRTRFVDEAKSLAKFYALPGIVSVKDFFLENGTAYIVMEFVEGETLKQLLSHSGGKLPADQVIEMMKPLMRSLSEIHKAGIIHRDISPDNIMVTKEGNVKLLDFGAARDFSDSGNRSLSVMLKPGYAPEEQYRSRGVQGPWTDVYALCATMYKAISGVTPMESIERVQNNEVKPPTELGVGIPPQQEVALMKGMAVLQKDRYQSIHGIFDAFYPVTEAPITEVVSSVTRQIQDIREENDAALAQVQTVNTQRKMVVQRFKGLSTARKIIAAALVILLVATGGALAVFGNFGSSSAGHGAAAIDVTAKPKSTLTPAPTVTPTSTPTPPPEPTHKKGWQDIIAVSAGDSFTIGLKSDGTVVVVGEKWNVDDWRDIIAVSAGRWHIIGLKSDGTVVADKDNGDGLWRDIVAVSVGQYDKVGLKSNGTVVAANDELWAPCDVERWQDIVAVDVGYDHTVGLKSDGRVVAVGSNSSGQCDVEGWRDIVAISAGGACTVGLKTDGTVVAIGYNGRGKCNVEDWRNIVAISAGCGHTVGLKTNGTVVAVGGNDHGECNVEGWRDIVAVSAGDGHTVGLKSDGTVVAVGDNYYGQCDVEG